MHGGADVERIRRGFLNGFERGLGEADFLKPLEVHAGRAAKRAAAFDVQRERCDRVAVIAERCKASARVRADDAAKAAIFARAKVCDASEWRNAWFGDADAARAADVVREGDGRRHAQTSVLGARQAGVDFLGARADRAVQRSGSVTRCLH